MNHGAASKETNLLGPDPRDTCEKKEGILAVLLRDWSDADIIAAIVISSALLRFGQEY